MLYESIEHANDTAIRFENKVFFIKLKVMLREFNGIFRIKQIEKPLTMLCSAVKQLGSG